MVQALRTPVSLNPGEREEPYYVAPAGYFTASKSHFKINETNSGRHYTNPVSFNGATVDSLSADSGPPLMNNVTDLQTFQAQRLLENYYSFLNRERTSNHEIPGASSYSPVESPHEHHSYHEDYFNHPHQIQQESQIDCNQYVFRQWSKGIVDGTFLPPSPQPSYHSSHYGRSVRNSSTSSSGSATVQQSNRSSALVIDGESEKDLFSSVLDKDGPLVGHMAGALALVWFNSWDMVEGVIRGDVASPELNFGEHILSFMRYLRFVVTSARLSQHSLLVALLYLCRFRQLKGASVKPHPTSESRALIVALMIADKHQDDVSYTCATWARMGNLTLSDVKHMEIEFLKGLDFSLHISPEAWTHFTGFAKSTLFPLAETLLRQRLHI